MTLRKYTIKRIYSAFPRHPCAGVDRLAAQDRYYQSESERPPANLLADLARLLNVSTGDLLGLNGSRKCAKTITISPRLERRLRTRSLARPTRRPSASRPSASTAARCCGCPTCFRQLPKDRQFDRFDLVELYMELPRDDYRRESRHVVEDSIHIVGYGDAVSDTAKVHLWKPFVVPTLKELH